MKRIVFLLAGFFMVSLMFSCKKESDERIPIEIIGKNYRISDGWRWDFQKFPTYLSERDTDEYMWGIFKPPCVFVAQKGNLKGIAGIASDCKVVSIRFDTDKKCVNAINTAWQEAKVDVISNSWGIGKSDAVDNAVKNAVSKGRNGKGCIVVFSSGNNNSSTITGPAALSEVITVGAIDRNGIRYGDPGCEECLDLGNITADAGSN